MRTGPPQLSLKSTVVHTIWVLETNCTRCGVMKKCLSVLLGCLSILSSTGQTALKGNLTDPVLGRYGISVEHRLAEASLEVQKWMRCRERSSSRGSRGSCRNTP